MAGALLLFAALCAAPPRSQLEALEARRRAEETAARLLAQQERSILDTVGEAEASLAEARADLRRVEAERALAEARFEEARGAAEAARVRMNAKLSELRPRLLARARMRRAGELRIMLGSRSLADLVKRHYLMGVILSRDLALLAGARAALGELERSRAESELEAGKLQELALEVEDRKAQAEARREERGALLAVLRRARELHERAAAEASAQAKKLADLVSALPQRGAVHSGPGGFLSRKGKLPLPAQGPITVGFGRVVNPKFNTITVQNGIDLGAAAGAPVRAVAPGRVVHAGWFKGYGNLVIVDHGDGYHTLVAHLAAMKTASGEEVGEGDVLGLVGDSGSLKGPYLHFELRENGRPVDPRPWLGR